MFVHFVCSSTATIGFVTPRPGDRGTGEGSPWRFGEAATLGHLLNQYPEGPEG
jgi:hypothetical protein